MRETHLFLIRRHLEAGKTLTAIEGLEKYKCFRLAARVYDLKHRGMNIEKHMVRGEDATKFARYYLSNESS